MTPSRAEQGYQRLFQMDLRKSLTPAILSYEGIQCQYMVPGVFNYDQFGYMHEHLRVLSGFYGPLHPFDGVVPYRLEMQRGSRWAGIRICTVTGGKNWYTGFAVKAA